MLVRSSFILPFSFLLASVSFFPRLHATISLTAAAINGTAMLANSGVYTAALCSAGKYSKANIPGLKKAREDSVRALAELSKVCIVEVVRGDSEKTCERKHEYVFKESISLGKDQRSQERREHLLRLL